MTSIHHKNTAKVRKGRAFTSTVARKRYVGASSFKTYKSWGLRELGEVLDNEKISEEVGRR